MTLRANFGTYFARLLLSFLLIPTAFSTCLAGQESHGGNTIALEFAFFGRLVNQAFESHPDFTRNEGLQDFNNLLDRTSVFLFPDSSKSRVWQTMIGVAPQWKNQSCLEKEKEALALYLKRLRPDFDEVAQRYLTTIGNQSDCENSISKLNSKTFYPAQKDPVVEIKAAAEVLLSFITVHPNWLSSQRLKLEETSIYSEKILSSILTKIKSGEIPIQLMKGNERLDRGQRSEDGLNYAQDIRVTLASQLDEFGVPAKIAIRPDVWNRLSQAFQIAIIFHESLTVLEWNDDYEISSRLLLDLLNQ